MPMQRPYTVRDIAERAGTGDHTPSPPEPPRCVGCGVVLDDPGRVYCERAVCRRRWSTTGTSTRRKGAAAPTIDKYSWD